MPHRRSAVLTRHMCRLAVFTVAALVSFSKVLPAQDYDDYDYGYPTLVLQITVDQLRGNFIDRYGRGIGDDGFFYLMFDGINYASAHHRHANTETVVGHTTIATGADPAIHGMVANLWFDRQTRMPFYNVQDADFPLVGAAGVDAATEIDPTQRLATADGRSPRNILSSTLADEIASHFGPDAKIFAVSIKDRGAISMAGQAGTAYWFSKAEGRFVTSTYYRDDYPAWMAEWDAAGKVASYANRDWTLLHDREKYMFADHDDQPWEVNIAGFGRTFPHNWGPADGKLYTTLLTLSPAGDEITVDFAKALITAENLGQDDVLDYLAISLSSTDYVGHTFGPSSLEAEDNFKRLDLQLADLFAHVDAQVGLNNTLIVLSADHGSAENPGYVETVGIEGGRVSLQEALTAPGFAQLEARFGPLRELIENFSPPYIYLNRSVIAERGLDPVTVEQAIARELETVPGIAYAVTRSDLRDGLVARTQVGKAVLANFHPRRSGDIHIVFEPHWFLANYGSLGVAAAHGSPWSYDTHVPLMFAGPNIPEQWVTRRVETVDIAPTIAAYLGITPPSGASGVPLEEITY